MKVLFIKDKLPTAMAGDVIDVKNGFGRNYLLPNRIAVLATEAALLNAAELREEAQKRRALLKHEWEEIAQKIDGTEVVIQVMCSETGRLYGSVQVKTIADAISKVVERNLNKKNVRIEQPIRTAGKHKIKVLLFEGVEATVALVVEPDKTESTKSDTAKQELPDADADTDTEKTADDEIAGDTA